MSDILSKIKDAAGEFALKADMLSNKIKNIEHELQSINLNMPYVYQLKNADAAMGWQKSGKNFRVCLFVKKLAKPFCEYDLITRMEFCDKIDEFLEALLENIKKSGNVLSGELK